MTGKRFWRGFPGKVSGESVEGACAAKGSPSKERGCGAPGGADKGGFRPSLVKREHGESQCWEMRTAKHQVLCLGLIFFPPLEIQKFAGWVREWEQGGLDNTRPGKKETCWEAEWALSPRPLLSKTRSPLIRARSVFQYSSRETMSWSQGQGKTQSSTWKSLQFWACGGKPLACGGKALQLVCAAMPRLPAPLSNSKGEPSAALSEAFITPVGCGPLWCG